MGENRPSWSERYLGGSEEAEQRMIERFTHDISKIQSHVADAAHVAASRTFHAKIAVGLTNAFLEVNSNLPSEFAAGYFQPGASFPLTIRFSNASPFHGNDAKADMRGAALRVWFEQTLSHDLLMTSYPVSHARNAWQFIEIAKISSGPKILVLPRLLLKLGPSETLRVVKNVKRATKPLESLAVQQFWSRAPILWGDAGPVRYTLMPEAQPEGRPPDQADVNYLRTEFARRLRNADVTYLLRLQRFVDERRTPIEDGATEWLERDSPFLDAAKITIPRQDLNSSEARAASDVVDRVAFNPWNCPSPFRPLGNLNRARRRVYLASATGWLGHPPTTPTTE